MQLYDPTSMRGMLINSIRLLVKIFFALLSVNRKKPTNAMGTYIGIKNSIEFVQHWLMLVDAGMDAGIHVLEHPYDRSQPWTGRMLTSQEVYKDHQTDKEPEELESARGPGNP